MDRDILDLDYHHRPKVCKLCGGVMVLQADWRKWVCCEESGVYYCKRIGGNGFVVRKVGFIIESE